MIHFVSWSCWTAVIVAQHSHIELHCLRVVYKSIFSKLPHSADFFSLDYCWIFAMNCGSGFWRLRGFCQQWKISSGSSSAWWFSCFLEKRTAVPKIVTVSRSLARSLWRCKFNVCQFSNALLSPLVSISERLYAKCRALAGQRRIWQPAGIGWG